MDMFENREAMPMLISEQMNAFDDPKWIYELKLDGFRCLAYLEQGVVDLRNKRNMRMLPKFPELKDIWKNVKGRCILDGEIVVLVNSVPDFYRLQKRTLLTDKFKIDMEAYRYPAAFVAFDCIYTEGLEMIWNPLMERKQKLTDLITESPRLAVSRYVEQNGIALYQVADEAKLEGVVAKRMDSSYLMGKRSKDWIKFKRMADEDFVVAGYIKKGSHTYSLILAKYKGDVLVYKGHVTAGVTKEVVDMLEVTGRNPFTLLPMSKDDMIWVKTGYVCVVEYMPNLNQALRQPVFKGMRDDISPFDVQL